MTNRLAEKIAIVTGAAQGGGKGIAEVLGRCGAKLILADIQAETGEATADELRNKGLNVQFHLTDLMIEGDVKKLVSTTIEQFGRLDILASNAGIYPINELETMTTEEWFSVINVNLTAPFWLTRECVPHMRKQGKGRIIFTSSTTGPTTVIPGLTHYAASKAGIEGFMRSAAVELAPYNITVNAVAPGAMLSPTIQKLFTDEELEKVAHAIPLGRLGLPEDIGQAYAYLASDEADYVTGIVIRCDGGFVLPELSI